MNTKGHVMGRIPHALLCLAMILLGGYAADAGAETVVYYHTDALGSPVAVTDANRNVIERTRYAPYGDTLNRPLHDGPGYTGHETDAATGLVYAQQRYYDPVLGRFIGVDPAAPDMETGARFNRFFYGNDNPYRFVDPDGRYVCSGSKEECANMSKALASIKQAKQSLGRDAKSVAARVALDKVEKFYGKQGENNGVTVKFSYMEDAIGQTDTVGKDTTITINSETISTYGRASDAIFAGTVVHEGQHGSDGQEFGRPINHVTWFKTEENAFRTESYFYQGLRFKSPDGIWDPHWPVGVSEFMREGAVWYNAMREVYPDCGKGGGCP